MMTIRIRMVLIVVGLIGWGSWLWAMEIPTEKWGVSIGNSREFSGLRFNTIDRDIEYLHGMTISFWKPAHNPNAVVKGIAIGIYGPEANRLEGLSWSFYKTQADHLIGIHGSLGGIECRSSLNGIALSLIGIGGQGCVTGLSIAGIGMGVKGNITGITVAGIGLGAQGNISGITLAGIGMGTDGDISGLSIGLVGMGCDGDMRGISLAGIGMGCGQSMRGLSVSAIGIGTGESLSGITITGIGAGAGKTIQGLTVAGIGIGAGDRIRGISLAGVGIGSQKIQGIAGSLFHIKSDHFYGMAVSCYNKFKISQNGISFGIINYARKLKGIQLGLINIARNNPKGLMVLPGINLHR